MAHSTCYDVPGTIPALDVPQEVMGPIVKRVADTAVESGDTITIKGCLGVATLFCRGCCRYGHIGSIVVIPDTVMLELIANGYPEVGTARIERSDGRSAHVYGVAVDAFRPL